MRHGAAFTLLAVACGGTTPELDDGLRALEPLFPVVAPEAPMPAALPRMTPCPMGWRTVGEATAPAVCEPWPEGGVTMLCGVDQAHFAGEPGCTRVGSPCPAGDFADALPPGRPVLFVLQGATGGDGSRGAPLGTLLQATARAASGDVIALSKGTFLTDGPLPSGVTLFGACVAQTTLSNVPTTTHPAVVVSSSAGVEVRNLRITGTRAGLAVGSASGRLHVEDVIVESAADVGFLAQARGQGTATNLVLRRTVPRASAGGSGIWADGAASITGTRVSIENNVSTGIITSGAGTVVDLTNVVIRDTVSRPSDRKFGRGVEVSTGASVTLTAAVIERSTELGALVAAGGKLNLTDTIIRDTRVGDFNPNSGHGMTVDTSVVTGTRVLLQRNRAYGALVGGAGGQLTLTDLVATDTVYSTTSTTGSGAFATAGGKLQLERAYVGGSVNTGIGSGSADTSLQLTDVTIAGTQSGPDGRGGFGLTVVDGASGAVTRVSLVSNRLTALLVGSATSSLFGSDVEIRGTRPDVTRQGGGALAVLEGATAALGRVRFTDNRYTGAYLADPGTTVTLNDAVVSAVGPDVVYGLIGTGVFVANGAHLTSSRLVIEKTQEVGLVATGAGSTIDASEVRVNATELPECGGQPMCDGVRATGVLVDQNGVAKLSRFSLSGNGGFGAQLVNGGQLDLEHGEVTFHQLGVNVRTSGFEVSRLDVDVAYRHNERKLDSVEVPLPNLPMMPPR